MTASSQNPPGALPPEAPSTGRSLMGDMRDAYSSAAFATFGIAVPAPAGSPETPSEEAPVVAPLHTAPLPMSPVQVTAGVISAAMAHGAGTPDDIAQAEQDAGIIFDPQRAQDIWDAAYDQARAEVREEIAERGRQLAVMADFKHRLYAVLRLCEGRPVTHHLPVGAIVGAAADSLPPTEVSFPMVLKWTGGVTVPNIHSDREQLVVECESAYGGRAELIVEGDDRAALASLLDPQVRDIHATCATEGCGTVDDYDASDPAMFGWSRLQIAALGDAPRWYCSDMCVFDALARAGHELAAEDRAAAVDPDEQGPQLPDHTIDEEAVANDGQADGVARCLRCGCTEAQACEGGCHWIPNRDMVELCSACATPAELFYAAGGAR
ncbi:hypothetical protein [Streptomyces sp. HGB0020]|uniref:hypothetical protein n=1 Tax=Streptomyces sp. HGB0020 TaxID=1078086 RepID=UPI00034EB89B|nr:hypothetical protein [Streptomyces sp. HGB0020]EPD63142.1 hypothetical protein HMPREF1211_03483 [Streptomyces sp. HGB0020]